MALFSRRAGEESEFTVRRTLRGRPGERGRNIFPDFGRRFFPSFFSHINLRREYILGKG